MEVELERGLLVSLGHTFLPSEWASSADPGLLSSGPLQVACTFYLLRQPFASPRSLTEARGKLNCPETVKLSGLKLLKAPGILFLGGCLDESCFFSLNLHIQQYIPNLTLKNWHVRLLTQKSFTNFSRNLKGWALQSLCFFDLKSMSYIQS